MHRARNVSSYWRPHIAFANLSRIQDFDVHVLENQGNTANRENGSRLVKCPEKRTLLPQTRTTSARGIVIEQVCDFQGMFRIQRSSLEGTRADGTCFQVCRAVQYQLDSKEVP